MPEIVTYISSKCCNAFWALVQREDGSMDLVCENCEKLMFDRGFTAIVELFNGRKPLMENQEHPSEDDSGSLEDAQGL